MKNNSSSISILGRIGVTAIALSIIYIFFGPPSYVEAEMINEVIFLFIVPLILIATTILLSFLIGMPIRMIPKWFNWWYSRPYIALILFLIGIIFCFLSVQSGFIQPHVSNSEGKIKAGANFTLLGIGWFVISFSLIHFYFESFLQFVGQKLHYNKK